MSDIVERSDVDISKIFEWGRVFEIFNPETDEAEADVYMKLLGDADLGRARVFALRKSAELRRKLKDPTSDEHVAWIRDINEMGIEDIINLIVIFSSRDLTKNAVARVKIPTPKPPKSNAKLEKLEQFQKDVDQYPSKRERAIADELNKEIERLKEQLRGKSKEELYQQYVNNLTDEFCEREAIDAFENYQTYLGCYTDNTYKPEKRFFKDYDEFDNLEPIVKAQFKDAYKSLDIEMSELKKLRRATP
jgi:hypothetical protein